MTAAFAQRSVHTTQLYPWKGAECNSLHIVPVWEGWNRYCRLCSRSRDSQTNPALLQVGFISFLLISIDCDNSVLITVIAENQERSDIATIRLCLQLGTSTATSAARSS